MILEDIIMKKSKRFAALLTAGLLALVPCAMASVSLTAFASTLTVTDTDESAHTYNAYQIITGTKDTAGNLSAMEWGDGVDSAKLITALNAKAPDLGIDPLGADATINQVAAQLAKINAPDKIQLLAKVFNEEDVLDKTAVKPMTKNGSNYTTADVPDGWYLVCDETDPLVTGNVTTGVRVKSANLLQVVGDTTVVAKHSLPTVDKKIIEGSEKVDANTASIGDVVTYEITTESPDVTGYDKYYFVLNDTLSKGLTYNDTLTVSYGPNNTVEPAISQTNFTLDSDGAATAQTGDYYLVQGTYDETNGTELKIVFEDCVNLFKNIPAGTPITVTYKAILNENAVITDAGNPNTVNLQYSNNPNATTDGTSEPETPDEPKPNAPTGVTPDEVVKTYTTALKLHKVDNKGTTLTGASFRITGDGVNKVVVAGTMFVADAAGTYYKLDDGTYTETRPESATDETPKYKKVTSQTIEEDSANNVNVEAFVDESGYVTFTGLGDGDYTISEIVVPDGYQKASDVTIKIESAPTLSAPNWTVTKDSTDELTRNETFQYAFNVVNTQFSNLPTTGGMGTKLFYLFGGLLAVGSCIVLVTKKRMSGVEK